MEPRAASEFRDSDVDTYWHELCFLKLLVVGGDLSS